MVNKLVKEINFQEFLENKDVEEKILELKLDEDSIKNWIISQKSVPKPKNPNPDIDENQEEKIEEIIDRLKEDLYIRAIVLEEEIRAKILEYNFGYNKIYDYFNKKII